MKIYIYFFTVYLIKKIIPQEPKYISPLATLHWAFSLFPSSTQYTIKVQICRRSALEPSKVIKLFNSFINTQKSLNTVSHCGWPWINADDEKLRHKQNGSRHNSKEPPGGLPSVTLSVYPRLLWWPGHALTIAEAWLTPRHTNVCWNVSHVVRVYMHVCTLARASYGKLARPWERERGR